MFDDFFAAAASTRKSKKAKKGAADLNKTNASSLET